MDRRLYWITRNGAFAIALYFAVVVHIDWLQQAVTAFVWSTLAITVWTISEDSRWRSLAPTMIPHAGGMLFDLGVLGSMFVAHWYWTAFAYAMMSGCAMLIRERTPSKR